VARTHRGRGIARALKHYQIEWARRHGVDYLFTENDVSNTPMLRINTDFGYRPLPAKLEVVKDLGAVTGKLRSEGSGLRNSVRAVDAPHPRKCITRSGSCAWMHTLPFD